MKLSQREKFLLFILAILVLIGGYYQLVFTSQYENLQEAKDKLSSLQNKVEEIKLYTDPQGEIQKKYKESEAEIASATEKYFPEIIQEKQLRIVDKMLSSSTLQGDAMEFTDIIPAPVLEKKAKDEVALPEGKTFLLQELAEKVNPPSTESTSNAETTLTGTGIVQKMEAAVEFTGNYAQIINFIKAVESYPKKIIISSVDIKPSSDATTNGLVVTSSPELSGIINLHFYGIPKMHPEQDSDYTTWDIFGVYGRMNPYMP